MADVKTPKRRMLYHYTDQSVLPEIVCGDSIWLTDVRYLNDSTEYVYCVELVQKLLNEVMTDDDPAEFWFSVRAFREIGIQSQPLFLASLSERSDLLSQWRAYCRSGRGVALGFDRSALETLAASSGGWLRRSEYVATRQGNLIRQNYQKALRKMYNNLPQKPTSPRATKKWEAYIRSNPAPPAIAEPAREFVAEALRLASFFKHPSFSDERECRVIVPGTKDRYVSFRSGPSYLVPYIVLPLDLERSHVLREVVIGPSPHPDLAREAVSRFLATRLSYPVSVSVSSVPFRAW